VLLSGGSELAGETGSSLMTDDDQLDLRRTVAKISMTRWCLNFAFHVLGPIVTAFMHAQSSLERHGLPSSDLL